MISLLLALSLQAGMCDGATCPCDPGTGWCTCGPLCKEIAAEEPAPAASRDLGRSEDDRLAARCAAREKERDEAIEALRAELDALRKGRTR